MSKPQVKLERQNSPMNTVIRLPLPSSTCSSICIMPSFPLLTTVAGQSQGFGWGAGITMAVCVLRKHERVSSAKQPLCLPSCTRHSQYSLSSKLEEEKLQRGRDQNEGTCGQDGIFGVAMLHQGLRPSQRRLQGVIGQALT